MRKSLLFAVVCCMMSGALQANDKPACFNEIPPLYLAVQNGNVKKAKAYAETQGADTIVLSAKMEEDLSQLEDDEKVFCNQHNPY